MPATYEPIATTTLGSTQPTIIFSSIPSTYTDLKLVFVGSSVAGNGPTIRLNGVTSNLYSYTYMYASASVGNNDTSSIATYNSTGWSTSSPGLVIIDLFNYTGSPDKTILVSTSIDKNGSGEVGRTVGLFRSSSAISSITLFLGSGNFPAGSTATLYGIKKA